MIITFALIGLLWRRLLGGYGHESRVLLFVFSPLLCIPVYINHGFVIFAIAAVVSGLYFCFGHNWSDGIKPLLWRYTVPAIAVAVMCECFSFNGLGISWAGIIISFAYNWCYDHQEKLLPVNKFIDGYDAYPECLAGFIWFLAVNLI